MTYAIVYIIFYTAFQIAKLCGLEPIPTDYDNGVSVVIAFGIISICRRLNKILEHVNSSGK